MQATYKLQKCPYIIVDVYFFRALFTARNRLCHLQLRSCLLAYTVLSLHKKLTSPLVLFHSFPFHHFTLFVPFQRYICSQGFKDHSYWTYIWKPNVSKSFWVGKFHPPLKIVMCRVIWLQLLKSMQYSFPESLQPTRFMGRSQS